MHRHNRILIMRICQVIFSTSRIDYLQRTLESQCLLDFGTIQTDKIFIDDYPEGRDDSKTLSLAKNYGYREIILHGENFGIGRTWTEFWSMIERRNYDFVWQQEDDVVILERISILSLINALQNLNYSQLVLMRQKWYPHETDPKPLATDDICEGFRIESQFPRRWYFSSLASLYPMERIRFPYRAWLAKHYPELSHAYLNEALIGKSLGEHADHLFSGHVKGLDGRNLCEHIGVISKGKRLLPGEPGSSEVMCDPRPKHSVTGVLV